MLVAEPFRLSKEQIGELTDWDVWELYIRPAVQKAREDEDRDGEPRNRKTKLPTREEYVITGMQLGGNRADLEKAYDQWAASEEGQRLTRGSNP